MGKRVFSVIGGAALAAFGLSGAGCLPTYEASPVAPQGAATETGPEQAGSKVSSEPTLVRPALPSEQAVAWTESGDPALIAARAAQEGPLEVSSRRHSCMKVKLETMGRVLEGLGINMRMPVDPTVVNGATVPLIPVDVNTNCDNLIPGIAIARVNGQTQNGFKTSDNRTVNVVAITDSTDAFDRATLIAQPARHVYCSGRLTLGLPLYSGRAAEATGLTTASITKQFDLFLAAADEIVAGSINTAARCMDPTTNKAAVIFNADNTCNESGITCLQGYPATPDQVALCSRIVNQAEAVPSKNLSLRRITSVRDLAGNQTQIYTRVDATNAATVPGMDALSAGKRLAVAAILSAANACE